MKHINQFKSICYISSNTCENVIISINIHVSCTYHYVIHTYIHTIQYNTMQCNAMQCNTTIQYNTIQYNAMQYNTIQYNTIQYNAMQYNTIQYNTYICTYIVIYIYSTTCTYIICRHWNIEKIKPWENEDLCHATMNHISAYLKLEFHCI